ncbi:MAG: hypothetical protein JSS81_14320 [Acidobacteria bacterium]|nr:hypothetical protein [Acidobacteriota bacterium]
MSGSRKNYNSIVFLTTLGVYLGLVLAGGAAPSVLAQAATTRDFDIKTEFVLEDDLDKKPDDQETDAFLETGLDRAIADFIEDLRRLKREGKYKFRANEVFSTSCAHSRCSADDAAASIATERSESRLADVLDALHSRLDIADRKGLDAVSFVRSSPDSKTCRDIGLALKFSKKELSIEYRFTRESERSAYLYAESLNRRFAAETAAARQLVTRHVYARTRATAENNQVFVVTRLPRAALDELFARTDAR